MVDPTIVPRSDHAISRRDIDSDALKVLYRLHEHHYVAYLVGGSVRDLLLGRRPKDFDIGTSAHPLSGQEAVPQLLDHRTPIPSRACEVRSQDHRGRDVPPPGRSVGSAARRRRDDRGSTRAPARSSGRARSRRSRRHAPRQDACARSHDPSRQHVRHARRGCVPARLHDQRALLRHRRRSRSSTT